MSDNQLISRIDKLPDDLKVEVMNYIEFLEQKHQSTKMHPKAGCMKGTFVLHEDFDEPLEDFSEYM